MGMSQRTTLASVGIVVLVFIILAAVVGTTKGQDTALSVQGFPFVQIGRTYGNGVYDFQVTQDLGNGWIVAKPAIGNTMFVNLNQTVVLFPKD